MKKNTIVFQSEGTFNPEIILTESNYDIWLQLVEMHFAERENIPTFEVRQIHQKSQKMDMKNGMLRIKR